MGNRFTAILLGYFIYGAAKNTAVRIHISINDIFLPHKKLGYCDFLDDLESSW